MTLNISQILSILGPDAHIDAPLADCEISSVICDSRELTFAPSTLFFALRTASADGHSFIPDLYRAGVRNFVVESVFCIPTDCSDANFIFTPSPLKALQQLAIGYRRLHPACSA